LPPRSPARRNADRGRAPLLGRAILKRALGGLLLLAASSSFAETGTPSPPSLETPRGPAQIRDGQLLAQPRLTLPALTPFTLAPGRFELRLSGLWSSSFSWTQDVAGETPGDRRFLIDGETAILDLTLRRGLGRGVDVGLHVTALGRGGGALDGFIDFWHRLLNAPNGNRPDFLRNAFRVEGRTTAGAAFSWNDAPGWGLGDLELEARWQTSPATRDRPCVGLAARIALPTSTGPYSGAGGWGGAAQASVDFPLARRLDLYAGMGVTAQDDTPVRGIAYEPARIQGSLAFEWRAARPLSLLVETNIASRLVANIDSYPGTHWLVNFGARLDVGARTRLDLMLTENIVSQQTTTDLALFLGFTLRP
jgi:hypothetical protein